MRDRIIGLGHRSSTGCVGQTRDRGYLQHLSVSQAENPRANPGLSVYSSIQKEIYLWTYSTWNYNSSWLLCKQPVVS